MQNQELFIKIDFEYEDENQNQHTTSESISIPVVQEHRLEASEIVVPPFVQVGQSFPVTLDFIIWEDPHYII